MLQGGDSQEESDPERARYSSTNPIALLLSSAESGRSRVRSGFFRVFRIRRTRIFPV